MPDRSSAASPFVVLAAMTAILGACTPAVDASYREPGAAWPGDRFAPEVTETIAALSIEAARPGTRLTHSVQNDVLTFATGYKRFGHGPMTVSMPSDRETARRAVHTLGEINHLLDRAGIDTDHVLVESAPRTDTDGLPMIVIRFSRFEATPEPCGRWLRDDIARTGSVVRSDNLGCATRHNLVRMVSDKADLLGPRTNDPALARRRQTVIDAYARGQATGTQRQDGEDGAVSRVNR